MTLPAKPFLRSGTLLLFFFTACLPLFGQGWWLGPLAEAGALRSFSRTGTLTEDEIRFGAGLGALLSREPFFLIPEFATDGQTHTAGLAAGGMFWKRFGIGLKANLLFDRFETVVDDPMGNPLPPLDNSQSYFLVGGQLLFLTADRADRSPVISLGFSTAGNGLFWGHLSLGYAWQTGRPDQKE
jgi:hypothetical protein